MKNCEKLETYGKSESESFKFDVVKCFFLLLSSGERSGVRSPNEINEESSGSSLMATIPRTLMDGASATSILMTLVCGTRVSRAGSGNLIVLNSIMF